MTDWVPQDDWSQVKVGDTVRAMRAEQMLTGKVIDRLFSESTIEDAVYAIVLEVPDLADVLTIHHGYWQLSVPAKPAVELPDEPGIYLTSAETVVELEADGRWFDRVDNLMSYKRVSDAAPFTRLEPVAVTAKKVLHFFEHDMSDDVFEAARKEFGVTE